MADSPRMVPIPDPTELTNRLVSEAKADLVILFDEKLNAIKGQLNVVERNRLEQKADTTKALDAAFAAAKEAVTGVDIRVNDLKERMTRIESNKAGIYAAAVIVAAVLGVLGFIIANGTP